MQERASNLRTILNERLESKEDFGLGVALTLANNPNLQEFIYHQQPKQAQALLEELIADFTNNTNYRGLRVQIHTSEGDSWLRSWNPNSPQDSLHFRPSIKKMLAEKKPSVSSNEAGGTGYAIRGLAPIFYQGNYLGSLEVLQGTGSVSRNFLRDEQNFITLLASDFVQDINSLKNNQKIGSYVVANDRWFSKEATDFAASLNLDALVTQPNQLTNAWFATQVPIKDVNGNLLGMHLLGEPASKLNQQVASTTQAAWLYLGLIVLLVIGMGITITWQIQANIVRPIAKSVKHLNKQKNDLTARLTRSNQDELKNLFAAFNQHSQTLAGVLGEVTETSNSLVSAADQMLANSNQSRELASLQLAETDQVASATNQMAASANEMAAHAQATLDATQQAEEQTFTGQEEVASTISAISNLAQQMQSMLQVIERLDSGSENIGKVIDTISDVADQTNLLALNAAIEAARAGEHGRGFAVVADEVRQLASRTQEATGEIHRIIAQVQAAASDVSEAIQAGTQQAEACNLQAEAAGSALENISQSVAAVKDFGMQIAAAAQEQSQVAADISQSMELIKNQAIKSNDAAEETQSVNLALVKRAEALAGLVKQFKI